MIKKIWNFIKEHPYITIFVICTVACFIDGAETREWNFAGFYFIALFLCCLISPFVRKYNNRKAQREDAEHLAKSIAIEQDKIAHPEKYKE